MQRLNRHLCLWLALLLTLCVSFWGCEKETFNEKESTSETGISASDVSIEDYKKHSVSDLLSDYALGPWLERTMEREQITNALLCPAEASNGRLHCYLYIGAFCDGDTLAFGLNPVDGTILIRHTAADANTTDSPYVFSFWVNVEEMPNVEIFQNDASSGILISYTDVALPD